MLPARPRTGGLGVLGSLAVHGALAGLIVLAAVIPPRPTPEDIAMVTLAWTMASEDSPGEPAPTAAPPVDPEPSRADPPPTSPDPRPTDDPVTEVARLVQPPAPQATTKPNPTRPTAPARTQTAVRQPEPRPAAPSPAAAPPTPAVISPVWNAAIAAWLHRNKTYPATARTRGEEGSGHVRFTVARDGRVLDVELTRPTGSQTLDEALRRMLTGATVPAFPDTMPHDQVTVQVQVRYSLDQ